jgi:acyl-CoA synthetase (NDP forming)
VVWDGAPRGLAFSKVISVGNQADLEASDFLEYLAQDPETDIIAAYVEGAKDGRRLWRALAEAGSRKRVVVWKVGRTRSGARAASSHTGALAGEADVWSGLLRQAGALQVRDLDELLDVLVALRDVGRPSGRRMAIVTGPGGPAVSAADACEEAGLDLADLSAETRERLRSVVGSAGTSVRNPVDVGLVLGGAAEMYRRAVEATVVDPKVDAVVVIGGFGRGDGLDTHDSAMAGMSRATRKPILHVSFGPGDPALERALAREGIGSFPSAERALQAYARVCREND